MTGYSFNTEPQTAFAGALTVIAGNLMLAGGSLQTAGHDLTIASLASPGRALITAGGKVDVSSFRRLGDVNASDGANISLGAASGAAMHIRAANVKIDNSSFSASGGALNITTSGVTSVADNGIASASTTHIDAGSVALGLSGTIRADHRLTLWAHGALTEEDFSGIFGGSVSVKASSFSANYSGGIGSSNGGSCDVLISRFAILSPGSSIFSDVGPIRLRAAALIMDGSSSITSGGGVNVWVDKSLNISGLASIRLK